MTGVKLDQWEKYQQEGTPGLAAELRIDHEFAPAVDTSRNPMLVTIMVSRGN